MSARANVVDGSWASCYSCAAPLAARGATVRLAPKLVARPEPKDGLPRFGLPRRRGHRDPREAADFLTDASTRDIGNPASIYVNCPNCDRGQVIEWPPRP